MHCLSKPFAWRKKWEKVWDEVKYCSDKCRMNKSNEKNSTLILGDQLNSNHSWYETVDDSITYVLMEIRTETDYAASYPKGSRFSRPCELLQ
jgi:hypothetical protein